MALPELIGHLRLLRIVHRAERDVVHRTLSHSCRQKSTGLANEHDVSWSPPAGFVAHERTFAAGFFETKHVGQDRAGSSGVHTLIVIAGGLVALAVFVIAAVLMRRPPAAGARLFLLPDWPARTEDISEIGIEIRFAPAGTLGKLVSEITGRPATLTIRIVDYPGEWLLDLPLAAHSYAEWSRVTLRLLRKGLRADIAREFLGLLAQHRADDAASEEVAKRLHDRYCAYLLDARDRHGLSFLQPGRFLCPGALGPVSYLWFAPLDIPEGADMFAPHTLGSLMAERFEAYKREVVERFYQDHFRHYSRQIVLVDVLRALLAGRDAFDDTRLALDAILESFRYGHGGILSRLLFGSHIDKVLFAATKADHVPDIQRDHLAALLRNMAAFPALEVRSSSAQLEVTAPVTGILTPQRLDNKTVLTKLLDEHGVVISGGQGKMAGKMWRWGTMGAVSEADMVAALGAFEIVIRQMGYPFEDGAAVNAALDVFARAGKKKLRSEAASLRV
jgi:YcjX-like family, DUF463